MFWVLFLGGGGKKEEIMGGGARLHLAEYLGEYLGEHQLYLWATVGIGM